MGGPFVAALLFAFACGPGPTEPSTPSPPMPTATTKITPTKPVSMALGPDCKMKAMEKLTSVITDAGMRSDLDASVREEEVQPADATAVLQKLAPKLTACNPNELEGCAYLTTTVTAEGAVVAVDTFVSDALPPEVVTCLAGVVMGAHFAAVPAAGKMTVPVTFTRTR